MVTPFVTGAVTGWWIQGTIFQLKNLTGIIFWWWWWPTCSFYLQGMHFSSETAKSLEIRKCNFINLICQNLTINKFHRLRVPPNQAQHNESANSVQKTSGRRKMMTILERFWQNWIILDTQLLTFMSQKWKVFVFIFPFGEYVLLCDKDILFSVELKVWTV